jgi:hypothetical protein
MASADNTWSSLASGSRPRCRTSSRMGVPVFTAVFAISAVAAYPIYGLSAVAMAVLRSSSSRQRASSARMPATHRSWSTRIACRRMRVAWIAFQAITGIMTLSSSCPASAAARMAASQPNTWKHTWFTISGTDGFTLPGMIEDPGCTGGS